LYASRTWSAAKLANAASGTAMVAASLVLIVSLRLTSDPSPRVTLWCGRRRAQPAGWVVGSRRPRPKRDVVLRARNPDAAIGPGSAPRVRHPEFRRRARIEDVARRPSLSSWLYKASRTTRDFEVLTGKNGGERYVKRRIRRAARRRGLGWWFRKTGL
jgi:hypothetical protein